tara:strand:+ start:926 stop:1111 length:186 start_codon:yes stop_codon:yes gene_type:complete
MRVGDLISFKPFGFGKEDWSNPSIVLEQYNSPDEALWVVWVDGDKAVIDDENYEISYLTSS